MLRHAPVNPRVTASAEEGTRAQCGTTRAEPPTDAGTVAALAPALAPELAPALAVLRQRRKEEGMAEARAAESMLVMQKDRKSVV